MDTLRFIDPQSLINRMVFSLDEEIQQSYSDTATRDQCGDCGWTAEEVREESNGGSGAGDKEREEKGEKEREKVEIEKEEDLKAAATQSVPAVSCSIKHPHLTFGATSESCNLRKAIQVWMCGVR